MEQTYARNEQLLMPSGQRLQMSPNASLHVHAASIRLDLRGCAFRGGVLWGCEAVDVTTCRVSSLFQQITQTTLASRASPVSLHAGVAVPRACWYVGPGRPHRRKRRARVPIYRLLQPAYPAFEIPYKRRICDARQHRSSFVESVVLSIQFVQKPKPAMNLCSAGSAPRRKSPTSVRARRFECRVLCDSCCAVRLARLRNAS